MVLSLEQSENIALYHYELCPFCTKTRRAIDELGLEIELKNIEKNHQYRIDLHHGGQKTQVPCLRIERSNGDSQWLYKSAEIINYLAKHQNELFHLTLTA